MTFISYTAKTAKIVKKRIILSILLPHVNVMSNIISLVWKNEYQLTGMRTFMICGTLTLGLENINFSNKMCTVVYMYCGVKVNFESLNRKLN